MQKKTKKEENQFINLLCNIILPSFILIKLSSENYLGAFWGLIIALSFPITYGIYDFIIRKDVNIISIFGFMSTLLTGLISFVEADKVWIIVKETSIPLLIAIFMLVFKKKGLIFFKELFSQIINKEAILTRITPRQYDSIWTKYYSAMIIPFIISACLNFILAYLIIESQPGTSSYNAEIGKMTALSFPVIALPSMIILVIIMIFLFKEIGYKTGLKFEEIIVDEKK